MFEKPTLACSCVSNCEQRSCGGVKGAASWFADPYGQAVFLIVDNEIALLIPAATYKGILEGYYATPSSGESSGF
jgi:hypothetical protein